MTMCSYISKSSVKNFPENAHATIVLFVTINYAASIGEYIHGLRPISVIVNVLENANMLDSCKNPCWHVLVCHNRIICVTYQWLCINRYIYSAIEIKIFCNYRFQNCLLLETLVAFNSVAQLRPLCHYRSPWINQYIFNLIPAFRLITTTIFEIYMLLSRSIKVNWGSLNVISAFQLYIIVCMQVFFSYPNTRGWARVNQDSCRMQNRRCSHRRCPCFLYLMFPGLLCP